MRRSLATIWLRARTAVTAWTRLPVPATDHGRARAGHASRTSGRPVRIASSNGDRRPEAQALLGVDPATMPGGRVEGDDAARVDDGDPVGEPLGLLHEVGHEHDRHAAVADALDQLPGVAPGLRVEPGGQLVEDRDPRVADQGERDRQPLLLAARELAEAVLRLSVEAELVDELLASRRASRRTRRTDRAPPRR